MKDILTLILDYRTKRGWSELQLAKEANVPQSTLSTLYRQNGTPSIQTLEKICSAFDISLAQFFAEANDEEPSYLNDEQKDLLRRWSRLNKKQREAVLQLIDKM